MRRLQSPGLQGDVTLFKTGALLSSGSSDNQEIRHWDKVQITGLWPSSRDKNQMEDPADKTVCTFLLETISTEDL